MRLLLNTENPHSSVRGSLIWNFSGLWAADKINRFARYECDLLCRPKFYRLYCKNIVVDADKLWNGLINGSQIKPGPARFDDIDHEQNY